MERQWWKSYLHFSNIERKGIVALLIIIILLLVVRIGLKYWVLPPQDAKVDKTLLAAWEKYKASHSDSSLYLSDNNENYTGTLFSFDPNTLDSAGFIRLGLRPRTTHLLLNWRRKGKVFYKKEDLKSLYTLSETQYNSLAPYIAISENNFANSYKNNYQKFENQNAPLPAHIDLNTTDSAMIVRLNGIGPTLAHKIIAKRNALGGFIKHEQLLEIYRFPDTTFKMLREKLIINTQSIRKLKLNTSTLQELSAHPYIGEKTAKNIILYREGIKRYENIMQLKQVPLMNEEIYRKIAPYFNLD